MNNKKREKLREAKSLLIDTNDVISTAKSKAKELLEKANSITDMVLDQEQDCLDNMPENLEYSERYEKMENAVENLEEAINEIESAIEYIEKAME